MSSRQIKWIREQLAKKNPNAQPEEINEDDLIEPPTDSSTDFSILKEDSSDFSGIPPPPIANVPLPPPPPKNKKNKKEITPEDDEAALQEIAMQRQLEEMEREANSVQGSSHCPIVNFNMQQLNLVRELKATFGSTQFDECIKIPKAASPLRFMGRRKRWPNPVPPYFVISETCDRSGDAFRVTLTEQGQGQSEVFRALERINDQQGLMQLQASSPFCPPLFPMACQSLLFQGEFDGATEIAVRGLWIVQQALPTGFQPLKSHLIPSPARKEFLDLVAFLARFAFRRAAFQTSLALWKFGMSLTHDDPLDFALLAAIPAAYAGDKEFIRRVLTSDLQWRGIPVQYVPDWRIASALLELPDNILPLANEIAIWPWGFREDGATSGEGEDAPELLLSVLGAMRRRIAHFFEQKKEDLEGVLETTVMVSNDMEVDDDRALAVSYWVGITDTEFDVADMVEEFVMPTG